MLADTLLETFQLFFKALGVPPERVIVALGGISYVVAHPLAGGFSMVGQTLGPGGKYCNKGALSYPFHQTLTEFKLGGEQNRGHRSET